MTRSLPIVAVFGSDKNPTLKPAKGLGKAIARAGGVLLTGGGREPKEGSVKERAMKGAREAGQEGRGRIGVLGKEERKNVWWQADGIEFSMSLGYGHRRNYVNAVLCDVAVAFDGGDGTTSEVAFALATTRPVILVGPEWASVYPLVRAEAAYNAFVTSSKTRVDGVGTAPVDRLITKAYGELSLPPRGKVEHVPLDRPPADIATLAMDLARHDGLRGEFPDLPDRADIADAYHSWLVGLEG